jgi:hypothetical protein
MNPCPPNPLDNRRTSNVKFLLSFDSALQILSPELPKTIRPLGLLRTDGSGIGFNFLFVAIVVNMFN